MIMNLCIVVYRITGPVNQIVRHIVSQHAYRVMIQSNLNYLQVIAMTSIRECYNETIYKFKNIQIHLRLH
jgi:hypothetical protein